MPAKSAKFDKDMIRGSHKQLCICATRWDFEPTLIWIQMDGTSPENQMHSDEHRERPGFFSRQTRGQRRCFCIHPGDDNQNTPRPPHTRHTRHIRHIRLLGDPSNLRYMLALRSRCKSHAYKHIDRLSTIFRNYDDVQFENMFTSNEYTSR